jgi:hypothetical protein
LRNITQYTAAELGLCSAAAAYAIHEVLLLLLLLLLPRLLIYYISLTWAPEAEAAASPLPSRRECYAAVI